MKWPLLVVALLAPSVGRAYVRSTTAGSECGSPARPMFWNTDTIPYAIDAAGSDDVALPAVIAAVNAAFQTWQDVSCSAIAFDYGGTVADPGFGNDGINVVTWVESGFEGSSMTAAFTFTTFRCSGEIIDADIEVNGEDWTWIVGSSPNKGDIQSVITHEAGHVIGFDHNPDPQSTMYFQTVAGDLSPRTLTADDAQGACDVYPGVAAPMPDAATGTAAPDAAPGEAPDAAAASGSDGGLQYANGSGGCNIAVGGGGSSGAFTGLLLVCWPLLSSRRRRSSPRHPRPSCRSRRCACR